MEAIGRVKEIWRYPIKSMGGEKLSRTSVGALGIPGDRGWALRDEKAGEIRGAKKLYQLMLCSAKYLTEPSAAEIPDADIELPDGSHMNASGAETSARLSELVGRQVTIWPRQPAAAREHYRRGAPDNPDMMVELRGIFGRLEDEPLPDLGQFPPEILKFTSQLGTYFDAFPFHVVTTATLDALSEKNPGAKFDVRRFRPNLLIETIGGINGLAEAEWSGRTICIGKARIKLEMPTVRCVMTTLPTDELPKDPSVLRTIVHDANQNVGSYSTISQAGEISLGDEVSLE
jgi:uncharacterized protein YcbX